VSYAAFDASIKKNHDETKSIKINEFPTPPDLNPSEPAFNRNFFATSYAGGHGSRSASADDLCCTAFGARIQKSGPV